MGHKPGIGAIFGIVTEEGVVKPDSPVVLLDRENKKIIRRQNTDVNGGFTFNGLNEQEDTYMVFATDEDGAEPKNALIQDRILPVPAYSGATLWSNWEYVCRRDGALGVWSGDYRESAGGNVYPYDAQCMQKHSSFPAPSRLMGAGTSELAITPGPEGAPHIPLVRLVNAHLFVALPLTNWNIPNSSTDPRAVKAHSCEITINLQSISGVVSLAASNSKSSLYDPFWRWDGSGSTNGLGSYPSFYSRLRYTAATRELSIQYRHGDAADDNAYWSTGIQAGTLVTRSHVFAEGAVPAGAVHIAWTLNPGVRLALFVNGALVQDWDLSAESPYLPRQFYTATTYSWTRGGFIFSGDPTATAPTDVIEGEFGPYAWYPYRLLTDAEVVEHYQALMDATVLPKLTGYVKEVITDRPAVYARLDDLQVDVTANDITQAEFMRDTLSLSHPSLSTPLRLKQLLPDDITVEQASPVVGGMATQFNGGYLRGDAFFRANPTSDFTVEAFINPSETPANGEQVLRLSNGTTPIIWLNLLDTRTLGLGYRISNATNESVVFTYVLPHGVDTHVVCTLDKVAQTAKLYINGVLEEEVGSATVTPTALVTGVSAFTSYTESTQDITAYVWIAGSAAGATTFKGKLCEVAYYTRALPASRALAHYNARLIP